MTKACVGPHNFRIWERWKGVGDDWSSNEFCEPLFCLSTCARDACLYHLSPRNEFRNRSYFNVSLPRLAHFRFTLLPFPFYYLYVGQFGDIHRKWPDLYLILLILILSSFAPFLSPSVASPTSIYLYLTFPKSS